MQFRTNKKDSREAPVPPSISRCSSVLFERARAEKVNNQTGSSGRINVFSSGDRVRVAPRALSICNADKMEMPERICKSSRDVIGFAAANDESDPGLCWRMTDCERFYFRRDRYIAYCTSCILHQ